MSTPSTFQKVRLTGASFASMFLLGVGLAVIGGAAPALGLSATEVNLLLTFENAGFVVAMLIFGSLADVRSRPAMMIVACLIIAPGFFFLYRTDAFLVNALIMIAIGAGMGGFEGISDPMLFELYGRRRNLAISINHLSVTLGSLLITVYLIFLQLDWRRSMVQAAVAAIVIGAIFALSPLPAHPTAKHLSPGDRLRIIGRDPYAAIMFVTMICGYGMQAASIGIVPTYLVQLRGFDNVAANLGLVTFIGGIAIGRIVIGSLTREKHLVRNLRLLFAAATVTMGIIYFVDLGSFVYIPLFIGGLSVSSLLPFIVTFTGAAYESVAGTAIAAVKIAIPAGGMVVPFVMSILAETFGFQISLLVPPLAGLAGSLLLARANRALHRKRTTVPN